MYYPNVFKLPIYNKSPDELYDSLVKAKEKRVAELMATGLSRSYAEDTCSTFTKDKWGFDNYIIGFLYVDYRSRCFEYRLAICKRKNSNKLYKMPLFTETKHYMSEQHINGIYTPPDETSNEETARLLLEDITLICNSYLNGAYCDLESFKLICNTIDYIKLISSLENGR